LLHVRSLQRRRHVLLYLFAAVWVGSSEISSNPPGETGGFRFYGKPFQSGKTVIGKSV
jgi:hypothetical protein